MGIRDFITARLKARLEKSEVVVLYDPDRRLEAIVSGLSDSGTVVIQNSANPLEAVERAPSALLDVGEESKGDKKVLVYVPWKKPVTETEKRTDLFYGLTSAGSVFPETAADSYQHMCVAHKPDFKSEIEALFVGDNVPDLDQIDSVGAGATYPQLQKVLGRDSRRELIGALMAPSKTQLKSLQGKTPWLDEYRRLVSECLGLESNVNVQSASEAQAELARFVLFSEFVLDYPGPLPEALQSVRRAPESARSLVFGVCDDLRTNTQTADTYVRLSKEVEQQLQLESHFDSVDDLGGRDTFLFEERAYLKKLALLLQAEKLDEADQIVRERRSSIWAASEERGVDWTIAGYAADILRLVRDLQPEVKKAGTTERVVELYTTKAYEIDKLHRRFEQAYQEALTPSPELLDLIAAVRLRHREFVDTAQVALMSAVEDSGWPPPNVMRSIDIFDTHLKPYLERHGPRVALIMVDAMRYEVGQELAEALRDSFAVELEAAAAQVPTITPLGMAALLPRAQNLELRLDGKRQIPFIGDRKLIGPNERESYVESIYGHRSYWTTLDSYLRTKNVPEAAHLIVLRTGEIDQAGHGLELEVEPTVLRLKSKLMKAVHLLLGSGVECVLLTSDHGFLLFDEHVAGDRVEKPAGSWAVEKERYMLGTLTGTAKSAVFSVSDVGLKVNAEQIALPRSLGVYEGRPKYMHGGLSLQEAIIPVLIVKGASAKPKFGRPELRLTYRSKTITSRLPSLEVSMPSGQFDKEVALILEARAEGNVVGETAQSEHVDDGGLVRIRSGESIRVPLRMQDAFEGAFEVVAIDPLTQVTYAKLKLTTDYVD